MVDLFGPSAKSKRRDGGGGFADRITSAITSALRPFQAPSTDSRLADRLRAAERQTFEREPPPPGLEAPRGEDLLREKLKQNPNKPGTSAYDRWVLSLREEETDPAYNVALRALQGPAARREEMRANRKSQPDPGFRPGEPVTPEDFEARRLLRQQEKAGPKRRTVLIGPDGEPLPDQQLAAVGGQAVPLTSELAAGEGEVTVVTGEQAARSGQYVWMGDMESQQGRFGGRTTLGESYMNGEDAVTLPYRWSPEQIAYAQEALGMDVTGFVDQQLISGWTDIVASAAGYAQAGRKMSPLMLLDMTFDATQAAKRGSGGGGGGGGGAVASLSQTTGFLNAVMLEEVGREATDAEAEQFHAAFLGAGEVDPTQFATDWIRSVVGEEAGVFQVATDYYTAMLQILGAQTQAEEPR